MYRPLPKYLTIQPSKIEGLGLFALKDIAKGEVLGVSHVTDYIYKNLIRTPLGGFINHSDTPNCTRYVIQRYHYIRTLENITAGQEVTLKYSEYSV